MSFSNPQPGTPGSPILTARIPLGLLSQVDEEASQEHRTRSSMVAQLLIEAIAARLGVEPRELLV
jgi:hypothetical protein